MTTLHGTAVLRVMGWLALCLVLAGCATATRETSSRRLARYHPAVSANERTPWDRGLTGPSAGGPGGRDAASDGSGRRAPSPARTMRRGDGIVINLHGIPSPMEIMDQVDDLGNVTLPLVGDLNVEGKSSSEIEHLVTREYIDRGLYRKINVTVRAQQEEYFVRGEVKGPGLYPISRDVTLMQAITTAGGYTEFARRTQIKILRGERTLEFNAKDIESHRARDPFIEPGDIVIVSRRLF